MSVKKAAKLYEDFRERKPRIAKRVEFSVPRAVAVIGYVDAIHYSTTHGRTAKRYAHKFAKGSRPMLCAGPGRNQIILVGGRYHVTDRGIVDLTPKGREIED